MKTYYNRNTLRDALVTLGIEKGDLLFIHSSFKSLGEVDGGAEAVVGALQDVVGDSGLILMPSFNLVTDPFYNDVDEALELDSQLSEVYRQRGLVHFDVRRGDITVNHQMSRRHAANILWRSKHWDFNSTSSTVGWLTEHFRCMPGTYRSNHYSHSVSARGKGAQKLVDGHLRQEGMKSPWDLDPWGRTYGKFSPMYKAYEMNGKLLMLGVDYRSSSYVHLVEVMYRSRNLDGETLSHHPAFNRPKLGEFWEQLGKLNIRYVGDSECRLFRIRDYVDAILREVEVNPSDYLEQLY